jgi:hypothetical protein
MDVLGHGGSILNPLPLLCGHPLWRMVRNSHFRAGMRRIVLGCLVFLIGATASAQQWIVGAEGGENRGSAFLMLRETKKLASGNEIMLWGSVNYLYYDVRSSGTETNVRSPGLSGGVMYRWILPNAHLGLGPGYDVRFTERRFRDGSSVRETEHGPVAMGDAWVRIADNVVSSGTATYSTANEWLASRANVMLEMSRALRVGPEVGWHGNDDLRVREYGGIVEIAMDEQWLWLRAGQARTRHRGGLEETQPYFSVGITRALR